jgi:hypothetical protein
MEQDRFKGGAFFQKIRMPYRPTRASEGGERTNTTLAKNLKKDILNWLP